MNLELAAHIEEFIEQVYNSIRLHSALDYRSPVEFEQQCISTNRSAGWLPASLTLRDIGKARRMYSIKPNYAGTSLDTRPGYSSA